IDALAQEGQGEIVDTDEQTIEVSDSATLPETLQSLEDEGFEQLGKDAVTGETVFDKGEGETVKVQLDEGVEGELQDAAEEVKEEVPAIAQHLKEFEATGRLSALQSAVVRATALSCTLVALGLLPGCGDRWGGAAEDAGEVGGDTFDATGSGLYYAYWAASAILKLALYTFPLLYAGVDGYVSPKLGGKSHLRTLGHLTRMETIMTGVNNRLTNIKTTLIGISPASKKIKPSIDALSKVLDTTFASIEDSLRNGSITQDQVNNIIRLLEASARSMTTASGAALKSEIQTFKSNCVLPKSRKTRYTSHPVKKFLIPMVLTSFLSFGALSNSCSSEDDNEPAAEAQEEEEREPKSLINNEDEEVDCDAIGVFCGPDEE
ncbi:hypothetical protein ACFL21_04795, partial [Patescibacteria group bacterium]